MKEYYYSKVLDTDFDDAENQVIDSLKNEGFGVLTEINVRETLKKKIDVDFRKYKILGACNPHFAYKALQKEKNIGVMLPCNVILQENEEGKIEVSAVDPISSMQAIENSDLGTIAVEVQAKLKRVIDSL